MYRIVCEVRPRLQTVNIFIATGDAEHFEVKSTELLLHNDSNVINLNLKSISSQVNDKTAQFDLSLLSLCFWQPKHSINSRVCSDGFLLSLSTKPSHVGEGGSFNAEILTKSNEFANKTFPRQNGVPIPRNCFITVKCTFCSFLLASFYLNRVLPLPSNSFSDNSQEWFCGCLCSTNDEGCDLETDAMSALEISAADPFVPKDGDILFSPGRLLIGSDIFSDIHTSDGKTFYCPSCQHELGTVAHSSSKILQFWNFAINIGSDNGFSESIVEQRIGDCFFDIIYDSISDSSSSMFSSVRIILEQISTKETYACLCLWIVESRLQIQIINGKHDCTKYFVVKLLWEYSRERLLADAWNSSYANVLRIQVSQLVLDEGIKRLKQSQSLIAKCQRQDKQLKISYVCRNPQFWKEFEHYE